MKELTEENLDKGLDELIDFVDLMLVPRYGEKIVAAIVTEFAFMTPRTVLGMASASSPEAYQELRTFLVKRLREIAQLVDTQEPIDITKAKQVFDELFPTLPSVSKLVH